MALPVNSERCPLAQVPLLPLLPLPLPAAAGCAPNPDEHCPSCPHPANAGGGSTGSAAKMLDLSLPGGGSATGRLMLRQCMVKPGPTASQNLAGCLQGCLG